MPRSAPAGCRRSTAPSTRCSSARSRSSCMHREIAVGLRPARALPARGARRRAAHHPHVVGVIDAGEDEGRPYIVFEYVEGETLKDRIRRHGRLPDRRVGGLRDRDRARARRRPRAPHRPPRRQAPERPDRRGGHGQGHRLRDRPLADRGGPDRRRPRARHDRLRLARAGARATTSTGQSDLYSLGVVLFEMLTGDVPFHGENQVAVAMKHVREELPDVQLRRPEVSSALAAVRRPRDGQGPRRAATPRPRADRRPRGRAGASRPRARARPPARRRPSSARCRRARAGGCRCACATRWRLLAALAAHRRRRGGGAVILAADRTAARRAGHAQHPDAEELAG